MRDTYKKCLDRNANQQKWFERHFLFIGPSFMFFAMFAGYFRWMLIGTSIWVVTLIIGVSKL